MDEGVASWYSGCERKGERAPRFAERRRFELKKGGDHPPSRISILSLDEEAQVENLRRKHTLSFKAKVALEAIKEQKTSAELASQNLAMDNPPLTEYWHINKNTKPPQSVT